MNTSIVRISSFLIALVLSICFAEDRCIMNFSACPETYNNQTIIVPASVVGISPTILACQDTASIASASDAKASFFFIIDNSGSMSGSNGTDRTGARFTVTKDLIDTIFKKQPNAQVGLAVFQQYLNFDISSTARFWYSKYFKAMSQVYDSVPNQAYMPLLTLNQLYDGMRGIDILDSALATTGSGNNVALRYTPNFSLQTANGQGATNINIGFLAAREAFANTTTSKNNQYIVFLSDGEANRGDNDPGPDGIHYFRDSTRNVPTTFTVFFNSGSSTRVPGSIDTMTQNIKTNGYSTSNPSSNFYAITASRGTLAQVLLSNVISRIDVPTTPIQMIINNITSNSFTNGQFVFADSFMLGTTTTQYTMLIKYQFTNPTTKLLQDSIQTIHFSVRRDSTAKTPPTISLSCVKVVIPINSEIIAGSVRNPVGPNNPITKREIINFYQNVHKNPGASSLSGALIGIKSTKVDLKAKQNGSYGNAVVFDALGNLVASNIRVEKVGLSTPTDSSSNYGVYWDCHNRDGRWVGSGTYLMVITTTDVNNATTTKKIKIGVSR